MFIPQDQERRTPLHAAACVGDVHIMDLLIESGEGAVCITDTPLCQCNVVHALFFTVQLCCSFFASNILMTSFKNVFFSCCFPGATVNAKDHVWLTPLHRAAASRNEVSNKQFPFAISKSLIISQTDDFIL